MQGACDEDDETIELDADDIERIIRYANCYGDGGWDATAYTVCHYFQT